MFESNFELFESSESSSEYSVAWEESKELEIESTTYVDSRNETFARNGKTGNTNGEHQDQAMTINRRSEGTSRAALRH